MYVKFSVLSLVFIFALSLANIIQAGDKTPQDFVKEAKTDVKAVSIHDVKKMIDAKEKIIILDVRDKEEFEKEHIPGAVNISRGQLEFLVEDKIPDKDARILVY
jgi:3-mercaptopyruvate sulfurtransferase SseA